MLTILLWDWLLSLDREVHWDILPEPPKGPSTESHFYLVRLSISGEQDGHWELIFTSQCVLLPDFNRPRIFMLLSPVEPVGLSLTQIAWFLTSMIYTSFKIYTHPIQYFAYL